MRKWLIAAGIFLAVIFFLPKIASTRLGKPIFAKAFEKKINGHVEIDSINLSWLGPQTFRGIHYSNEDVLGKMEELQIEAPFWSFSGPFMIKNGNFSSRDGQIEKINGKIDGSQFQLEGNNGQINVRGDFFSKAHFDIYGQLDNLPVTPLDKFLNGDGLISALFGHKVTIKGSAKVKESEGIIDLDVSSPNIQTSLKGNLTKDTLTLREQVVARIYLSAEFGKALLKNANPLFLSGVESQNPIELQIDSKGFSYPLSFSIRELKIGKAQLNLGKVRCQNGKSLASIMSLLNAKPLTEAAEMSAWFTPLTLRLDEGILQTERMDVLFGGSVHLCSWGNIDLAEDRLHMFLGIPSDTLEKSFGSQNLSQNYVLTLPIKGTTKNPVIEKGAAIAQIAALIAKEQIGNKKKGIGALVDIFSKPKEDANIPPAKRPFPWEK